MTWYAVADTLAGEHTVICPDLRGYGQSSKPAGDDYAQLWWHWFFLGQTAKPAERLINDPATVPIKSGHHMAEENPAALADALAELLRR
jgi:pimeloyl-ACP methyl ester carboxylesterase